MIRDVNIGSKKYTKIVCLDTNNEINTNSEYLVLQSEIDKENGGNKELAHIKFQNGPIKEAGINGIHNEDLIAIVMDRLNFFQKGIYACEENSMAIIKLQESLMWLRKRTQDRDDRGVEGTHNI